MEERLPRRIAWFAPWTWKRRWKVVGVLLLVLVGYPLSVGPATWLHFQGWLPAAALVYIYWPLEVIVRSSDTAAWMVKWYTSFYDEF